MRIVELGDGWKSILKPSILYGNKHICTIEILRYSFDHSKYYRNILITFFKPWYFKVTLQYTMVYFVVLVLDWCADGTLEAAIKCYIIQHRFVFYYVTKECIWYTFLTYGIIMRGCWHTYLQKIFWWGQATSCASLPLDRAQMLDDPKHISPVSLYQKFPFDFLRQLPWWLTVGKSHINVLSVTTSSYLTK